MERLATTTYLEMTSRDELRLPRFIGKGVGGELLTAAVARAWEMGATRVWLHTCTLDHPQALSNYQPH